MGRGAGDPQNRQNRVITFSVASKHSNRGVVSTIPLQRAQEDSLSSARGCHWGMSIEVAVFSYCYGRFSFQRGSNQWALFADLVSLLYLIISNGKEVTPPPVIFGKGNAGSKITEHCPETP